MVELGYHQPVVAPTKSTALYEWRRNTWDTYTIDGGRWEQFSSGAATALGRLGDDARWVPFAPAEVRSTPVVRDGRVVGVSFREDGSAWAATGGRVADDAVPERAFVVDVEPGAANEFAVRTTRGDVVFVDGPVLARVVGESEAFRGAERAPVALAVSRPVDVSGQVRGFYQTLIRDFGFRDSVFEARGGVEVVAGADGTPVLRAGDGWAEHRAASLASADGGTPRAPEARADAEITLSDGPAGHRRLDGPEQAPAPWVDQRPMGVDVNGEVRRFEPGEVRVQRMWRKTDPLGLSREPVGLTFLSGGERSASLRWGAAPRSEHLRTFVQPVHDSRFPSSKGAMEAPARWRKDAMYVAVRGAEDSFELRLTDGSRLRVDGSTFGRVVSELPKFQKMAEANEGGAVVLLAGRSGAGVAARDFQQALMANGWHELVVAPTTDVHLRTDWPGRGGQIVVDRGGSWRAFPLADVVQGRELEALTRKGSWQARFHTSEVRVASINGPDGRPQMLSFVIGKQLRHDLTTLSLPHAGTTSLVEGATSKGWQDGLRSAPWPERSAYLTLHGFPDRTRLELTDGRSLDVSGEVLATVLQDLRVFRDLMSVREQEALTLLSCSTAAERSPGGVAFDLQRTLAGFGYRQPVVAPSTPVRVGAPDAAASTWDTVVINGGRWEQFSSGRAWTLGELHGEARWIPVEPADVRSRPIMHEGRPVGVSFWREGEGESGPVAADARTMPLPRRTFLVSAESDVDGRVVVHTRDGATVHLDGPAFARVVGASETFRGMGDFRRQGPITLAVSAPLHGRSWGHAFHQVLNLEFEVENPVHQPRGEAALRRGENGAPVVWAQDGWTVHDRTADVKERVVRPSDGPDPDAGRMVRSIGEPSSAGRLHGVDATGGVRRFEPGEVQVRPMVRGGEQVGLTFLSGSERSASLRWAGEPRSEHLRTFVHPEGSTSFPSSKGAAEVRGPWLSEVARTPSSCG
jgi:hypothetical protein